MSDKSETVSITVKGDTVRKLVREHAEQVLGCSVNSTECEFYDDGDWTISVPLERLKKALSDA